jgi:hypothetical protein
MSILAVLMLVVFAWTLLLVSFVGLCMAAKRADQAMLARMLTRPARRIDRGSRLRLRGASSCAPSPTAPPRGRSATP